MTSYERLTQKRTDKPPNDPSVERWVDGLAKYPRSNFCLLQQAVAIDACQVPPNELLTILALTRRTSQAENMQDMHNAGGLWFRWMSERAISTPQASIFRHHRPSSVADPAGQGSAQRSRFTLCKCA